MATMRLVPSTYYRNNSTIVVTASAQDTAYLKVNGSWVEVSEVYKKINGSWVKQTSLSNVFDSGTNYKLNQQ